MDTYILPAFLGVGLAASCGLRTFLPLLLLSLAAHFHLFGVNLNPGLGWLGSTTALWTLGLAAVLEFAADKIPMVDHLLGTVGTVTRPLAGILAASAAFSHLDPTTAAIVGLVIGAPAALAVHTAQVSTRAASTVTTAGIANPFISLIEEALAGVGALVSMAAPLVVPVVLIGAGAGVYALLAKRGSAPTPHDETSA